MAYRELSPAQQEKILRLQQLEQTIQNIRIQLGEVNRALSEIEMTKKELQKLEPETEVWQTIGSVMFPKKAGVVLKQLSERAELLELKQKSFSSQESQNVKRFEELQTSLTQELGSSPPSQSN